MDCEQFDQIVLDMLYGELSDSEELAAARRHMDRCERCAAQLSGLRSARRAATLPQVDPPPGVRARVMEAARAAQRQVPWPARLGRWVSVAGSYAMRPQLAMAALLLLMIGSSLLLLRGRPGAGKADVVHVTEQGVPERDRIDETPAAVPERLEPLAGADSRTGARAEAAPAPREDDLDATSRETRRAARSDEPAGSASRDRAADEAQRAQLEDGTAANALGASGAAAQQGFGNQAPAAAQPAGGAPPADDYAAAMALYEAGDFANAYHAFDAVAQRGGANAASAMLYAGKSVRNSAGCAQALPRFESVMGRFGSTNAGIQARWEAASCARIVGDLQRARQYLTELAQIESQRQRAEAELARLSPSRNQNQNAQRAPAAAAPSNRAQQRPAQRNNTDRSNAY